MYRYTCMVCKTDFPSNVIPVSLKYRICTICILTYFKVGRYFRKLKEDLKPKEYATEDN